MRLQESVFEAPQTSSEPENRSSDKPADRARDKSRVGHRRIRLHKHGLGTADPHATRFAILPIASS